MAPLTKRQDALNHSNTKPRGASTWRKSGRQKTNKGRARPRSSR